MHFQPPAASQSYSKTDETRETTNRKAREVNSFYNPVFHAEFWITSASLLN